MKLNCYQLKKKISQRRNYLDDKITHALIFKDIKKKFPRDISNMDSDVLQDIVLGVGDKDDSLVLFHREVSVYDGFLTLGAVNKIAGRYAVHEIYKEYIGKNYVRFEETVLAIGRKARELKAKSVDVSFEIEAWNTPGRETFSGTDLLAIDKLRGLEVITSNIYESGYRELMRSTYSKSADERAVTKYSIAFNKEIKQVGGR